MIAVQIIIWSLLIEQKIHVSTSVFLSATKGKFQGNID